MQSAGQGATEYLVLLAVVLVIALVGIALLGFFPGTASEAQARESELYWKSASPVAITEWAAGVWIGDNRTYPYLRIRNNGLYPIRIVGVVGADGGKAPNFATNTVPNCNPSTAGWWNIADYYYMAPGEEKYFAWTGSAPGLPCDYEVATYQGAGSGAIIVGGATSVCQNSVSSPDFLVFNSFGFEYVTYVEGQQITKRQAGKALVIRCGPPG